MSKKLVYFNHGGFGDTDITVLKYLNKDFELIWFYLDQPQKQLNLSKKEAIAYAKANNIDIRIKTRMFKIRSIRNVPFFYSIIKEFNSLSPDIIFTCISEWSLSMFLPIVKCRNIVHGIHDVRPHTKEWSLKNKIGEWIMKGTFKVFPYSVVFSVNQYKLFKQQFDIPVTNLGMSVKDFGSSEKKCSPITSRVNLLFFGYIVKYKGLDNLIETIESLYNEGYRNIHLTIAGNGPFWERCKYLIKTKNLYSLKIRFVENNEIPDLMCSHHFLVLPYRDATQSGPLLTALNYELPIIAPNYGCFSDTYNKRAGILYESDNLRESLICALNMSERDYSEMRIECAIIKEDFSEKNIAKNYADYFESL